jgi:hypothetical protein
MDFDFFSSPDKMFSGQFSPPAVPICVQQEADSAIPGQISTRHCDFPGCTFKCTGCDIIDLFHEYSIHLLSTAGHLTKSYDGTDDFMLLFPRPWSHAASSSPSQPSLRRSRDVLEDQELQLDEDDEDSSGIKSSDI